MTQTPSASSLLDRLVGPAVAFAVGVLAAGYATLTAWTTAYTNANPATGQVSGGSAAFTLGLFVVGAVVAFLAVFVALDRVLDATDRRRE